MSLLNSIKALLRWVDDEIHARVGPIRVLFMVRNQYGLQCQLPLITEIAKRPGFKIGISKEFTDCLDWPDDADFQDLLQQYELPIKTALKSKWHYVLITDVPYVWFNRHTTLTLIGHGAGFGNLQRPVNTASGDPYMSEILSNPDVYLHFMHSQANLVYIKALNAESDTNIKNQFFVTGFPRLDQYFHNHNQDGAEFLSSVNLSRSKKTIIIGSHWTESALLPALRTPLLEQICTDFPDHNVIFMGHARLWRQAAARIHNQDLWVEIKELETQHSNFRFLPLLENTLGLVNSADVFVGDHSSFMTEFCIVDKPIVFFDHPEFEFVDKMVYEQFKRSSFTFSNLEGVSTALSQALENPKQHTVQRAEYVDTFAQHLGESTLKLANILNELGRVCGPHSSSWKKVIKLEKEQQEGEYRASHPNLTPR